MGKVWSSVLRPVRTFNVANRAERLLAKPEARRSPKYSADVQHLEHILKENPEIVEQLAKKDPSLDNRLKDIFVSSTDPDAKGQFISSRYNPKKPLPTDKKPPIDYEFGFKEPDTVKPGFITTRGLLQLISDHKNHPHLSVNITAKRFGISEDVVRNILKYYGVFDLHVPQKSRKNPHLMEYKIEKIEEKMSLK